MDIKAYIASGILEQYVLGTTTAVESAEVLRLSAMYPEIKAEIEAIEDALFRYAQSEQRQPPAQLKASILARLDEETTETQHEAGTASIQPGPMRALQPKRSFNWLAAASVALLAGSAAINIWLYNKWQNSETALAAANSEKQLMADNSRKMEASYRSLDESVQAIMSPDIKPVNMNGLPDQMPGAVATVYWNTKNNEVFLNVKQMPEPPAGKQYQLWAIVDGTPVDAGVIDGKAALSGVLRMKDMQDAVAFAVSLEKEGGNPKPTTVVMLGPVKQS